MEAGLLNVDTRLDQQVEMLVQMQTMLQDAVVPGRAGGSEVARQGAPVGIAQGPGGPIEGIAGPGALPCGAVPLAVAGAGSHADDMAAQVRLGLWQNSTSHKYWLISGKRPSLMEPKRQEIHGRLKRHVLVTG